METGRHVVLVTSQVCLSLPWSTVYEDWSAAPSWLPEWRTHSWIPCSTPLCWYPTKVHTASHSTLHTHAKGTHATILSKDPCAHTFVVHTALVIYYANTSGVKKREGEQKEIITAQPCCPLLIFTVIPWANLFLSQDTVTQTKYSHHMAVYTQRIFNKYTHTHTHSENLERRWNEVLRSHMHTTLHILFWTQEWFTHSSHSSRTRQGCLLLPVSRLKGGVKRRWWQRMRGRRGRLERRRRRRRRDQLTICINSLQGQRRGTGRERQRNNEGRGGGGDVQKGRKQERKKKCDDQWRKLIVHRTSIILDATLNLH